MIIYLTTNIVNGKKYVGLDRKNKPTYIGSGSLMKKAIKKYGKNSFRKEILEVCDNENDLIECEKKWICYFNAVNNPDFYNLHFGGVVKEEFYTGKGGFKKGCESLFKGKHHTPENIKIISIRTKEKTPRGNNHYRTGTKRPYNECIKMSKGRKGKCLGGNNPKAIAITVIHDDGVVENYDCVKDASNNLDINNNTMRTLTTSGKYSPKYKIRVEKRD